MLLVATGCSTVGEALGVTPSSHLLGTDAKALRASAPVPAPVPRELAMSLLPPHVVEPGEALLVQLVEPNAQYQFPSDQTVLPDGTIDLVRYGRHIVAGKTLPEIETLVREAIKAKEKNAVAVTVRLTKPAKVFYVLGEVTTPGAFPITGRDTVLSAILQAGGVTRRASEQNAVLSRPTTPEGCRVVYPVCYTNIVQLGDTTTNYQIQPGDRIFVPSKGRHEDLFGGHCRRGAGPCNAPQVSCFGGNCAPASGCAPIATVPVP
jgi:protein involved in polysaccharide export with SLBB domain